MSELNREQIKKALECCGVINDCGGCTYSLKTYIDGCVGALLKDALDLINELTEEKERLKADTVRKMQNRLYEELRMYGQCDKFNKTFFLKISDQIAKEMLEENENGQREND